MLIIMYGTMILLNQLKGDIKVGFWRVKSYKWTRLNDLSKDDGWNRKYENDDRL